MQMHFDENKVATHMTKYLEQQLGRCLSTQEVADYLNLDKATVRKHYKDYGGVRRGRNFKFFEKLLVQTIKKEIEDAQQARQIMGGPSSLPQEEVSEERPSNKTRSIKMGTQQKGGTGKQSKPGRHGL